MPVDEDIMLGDIRKELLKKPIKDYMIHTNTCICDLIEYFNQAHGFMAGHIIEAAKILAEMWSDDNTTRFLAFTANIVATGLRGVLTQLIREGFPHIIITTCGTIDHDIARGTGRKYYKGTFYADDALLRTLEIHRLGNIFIPFENYGIAIEDFTRELLRELANEKKEWSPHEILRRVGEKIQDPFSILRAAAEKNIPVIVPGITDGAFGTQIVIQSQFTGLKLDVIGDEKLLADKVFEAKKLGGLIIGGGISKHHTIWWSQFRDGLDYVVYLTTAVEYDGSLSGAQPREAISWGKLKAGGRRAVVYGDATITLPLVVAGAKCIMEGKIKLDE
ncbi:deoxyhypusine synthase [Desulfurococcaceae archaeon MEX13E-LK6-19]|nr:deoxyhypusine synthase [Desulfurococcaceae archaeon MEX13E-LK6-19]